MKEYPSPIHESTLYVAEDLFEAHKAQFIAYVEPFCTYSEASIATQSIYKKEHTFRVVEFAKMLAMESSLFFEFYPILLSALYHDIGRFEQYKTFNTFKDSSSCNHGHLGVKIAKKNKFLSFESKQIQQYVYTTIALHNIYILPKIPPHIKCIVDTIRDADRLDIFHKLTKALSNNEKESTDIKLYAKNIPNAYNPVVLRTLQEKKMVSYADILYYNDIRLMLFSWHCNFSTQSATDYIKRGNFLQNLYNNLPKTKEIEDTCLPILS